MDTIETVIGLMRQHCFMASLDLSNAYFSIPIAETNRCFLKFEWKDELYQFTVMPNGLYALQNWIGIDQFQFLWN